MTRAIGVGLAAFLAAQLLFVASAGAIVTQSISLLGYEQKLDGQWFGTIAASDGNCYFASSSQASDTGAAFFKYNPLTDQITLLAQDISCILGEDPRTQVPQGKIHSNIVEYDGWLYMETHLGNYWTEATNAYSGGHAFGYNLSTGQFRDFGVMVDRFTGYGAVQVDPVRNCLYAFATPQADADIALGARWIRYDIATGQKTDLGAFRTGASTVLGSFLDSKGDLWFGVMEDYNKVYVLRSGSSQVESFATSAGRWPGGCALEGDRYLFANGHTFWQFDASKMPDTGSAFTQIADLGSPPLSYNFATAVAGDTIFFVPTPVASYVPPLHLMSLSLDSHAITDWGEIYDQDGRTPFRVNAISADGNGHVFITADWYNLSGDQGSLKQLSAPGSLEYTELDRSQRFAVVYVPEPATLAPLLVGLLTARRRRR